MKRKYTTLLVLAAIIVLVDQITKEIVTHTLSLHENLEVIPGFFSLTHIRNTGGAFGLFAGKATWVRTLFFLAVSLLALGIIFSLYTKIAPGKPLVAAALAMVFGGALGNLIDRFRFGEVVDFLDFHIGAAHWPAFNVADSAISVGVGVLCFLVLLKKI
ncbi:MAG: signal peptidase II [Desulfobacterales bacterium]|nr:signal peptidase II [Desulfobacterales bacterium]